MKKVKSIMSWCWNKIKPAIKFVLRKAFPTVARFQ